MELLYVLVNRGYQSCKPPAKFHRHLFDHYFFDSWYHFKEPVDSRRNTIFWLWFAWVGLFFIGKNRPATITYRYMFG
ncbi:MAG: hypothetical protein ABIQ31_21150 [Ferruginibacter sp.]